MKKILLIILTAWIYMMYNISSVSALTYGGTANYSIPSVYSNTGVQLYSASAPVSGGAGANPIFDQDL
jgi:hypothetical protein